MRDSGTRTRTVYVVSFAPDYTGRTSVGGFDWYVEFGNAAQQMRKHVMDGSGFDLMLRAVLVPADLDGQDLTDWLDQRQDLWDVPSVPREGYYVTRSIVGDGTWVVTDGTGVYEGAATQAEAQAIADEMNAQEADL